MTVQQFRDHFPILTQEVYGKQLVYFDNAATTQRPKEVVNKLEELSLKYNSNIHRAVHFLAVQATEEYEKTRDFVKDYINAKSREEIVFTSGTTHSINLVAFSFGEAFVHEGDEIIITEAEHHSNIVPWQMMCNRKCATLKILPIDNQGHIQYSILKDLLTDKTKLLAVCQISNVLGLENDLKNIINVCHSVGCKVLVDGAQGIVHGGVNVQEIGCDFYAFSGHKIFAASGVGVLYGKKELLEKMPPYMGGGEMIETVRFTGTTYAQLPEKFEAGTQNINSVPTLIPALSLAKQVQNDKDLVNNSNAVRDYLLDYFMKDERIHLYGVPRGTIQKINLFSFTVDNVHHQDLALLLDKMGIAVRSGQMCAEPLMDRFGVTGMVRISLAPYNTMEEAQYFTKCLEKAINMLI